MRVDHYGVHRIAGDIALLIQDNRIDHVLGVPLEYEVKVDTRRPCTHSIDLDLAEEGFISDDPLFQAMLPIPKIGPEKPLYLEDTADNRRLIQELGRLTTPGSFSILQPFWIVKQQWLQETNIQPLAIYGVGLNNAQQLLRLMDVGLVSQRRLIVLGPGLMAIGERGVRITTSVSLEEVQSLPLEKIGAWALKQHMLGKWRRP